MNIRTFSIGGVHPEENKLSNDAVTQVAALPKQAIFPLSQHIGAPAKPVVAKGDKVKVGTLIAEAGERRIFFVGRPLIMDSVYVVSDEASDFVLLSGIFLTAC